MAGRAAASVTAILGNFQTTHQIEAREAAKRKSINKVLLARQHEARMKLTRKLPYQNKVKAFYELKCTQISIALLILVNFLVSAFEAQYLPVIGVDDDMIASFRIIEYFFGYAFLVELCVNLYGGFFWEFTTSAWNIFDFFIVVISLLALYMAKLPGITVLRLFRAFRVVRLFKRIKTMRKMMDSIMKSLPGMSIAFAALFLIMGIYAIIGVEFWHELYPDFFGNFLKAVLSLLQIMTFDSWCSGIARDIIYNEGAIAGVFFITYVFISSIIMANVLIALLLDEFMNSEFENEPVHPERSLNELLEKQHEELKKILLGGHVDQSGTTHKGFTAISDHILKMKNGSGGNVEMQTLGNDQDKPFNISSKPSEDVLVMSNKTGVKDDSSCFYDDLYQKHNITPDHQMEATPSSFGEKRSEKVSFTKFRDTDSFRVNTRKINLRRNSVCTLSDSYANENELPREVDLIRRGHGRVTSRDIHLILQRMSKMDQDISAISDTLKELCLKVSGTTSADKGSVQFIKEWNDSEKNMEVSEGTSRQCSNSLMLIERGKISSPIDRQPVGSRRLSLADSPKAQEGATLRDYLV